MGPLSIKLDTQVKTSIPMFAEKVLIPMKLTSVDEGETDKGKTIKFTWELIQPAPSLDPENPILPGKFGSKYFDTVFLYDKNTPPGEITQDMLAKIAKRQDAVLGTGDPENKKGKPLRPAFDDECVRAMLGHTALIEFKVKKGEFEGNEIKQLVFPGDAPKAD